MCMISVRVVCVAVLSEGESGEEDDGQESSPGSEVSVDRESKQVEETGMVTIMSAPY